MIHESRMAERRHELLADMSTAAARLLEEYGVPGTVANLSANALADHMAEHWGGQMISFPKDHKRKLCLLDLEIYRQFTGYNHADLAIKYRMSERGMRKVIDRVKARLAKQSSNQQLQLPV